mmetsp:Transcript_6843/g.25866  ORF Transcript_6843/g.25866 Transcript_6843/m.25866 type:complete len:257 (+) Transcript_6843:120-890(+)
MPPPSTKVAPGGPDGVLALPLLPLPPPDPGALYFPGPASSALAMANEKFPDPDVACGGLYAPAFLGAAVPSGANRSSVSLRTLPAEIGRSACVPFGAGAQDASYSFSLCSWYNRSPLYLQILNPLSTLSRGAIVAVSRRRPSGLHSAVTAHAARVAPTSLYFPSCFRSKNFISPGRFPNPASKMNRPNGFQRTVLCGPAPSWYFGSHFLPQKIVAFAGMYPYTTTNSSLVGLHFASCTGPSLSSGTLQSIWPSARI